MSEDQCIDPQYLQKKALTEQLNECLGPEQAKTYAGAQAGSCSSIYFKKPLALLKDRIEFHNRMANNLHALKRALPQEMNHAAEQALCDLICGTTK